MTTATETEKAVTDWRGTPVVEGDTILYAVKHSTAVETNEAVVLKVGHSTEATTWDAASQAYLPAPFVEVAWQRSSHYGDGRKRGQRVTLHAIQNLTVINRRVRFI